MSRYKQRPTHSNYSQNRHANLPLPSKHVGDHLKRHHQETDEFSYKKRKRQVGYKRLEGLSKGSPSTAISECSEPCFLELLTSEEVAGKNDWIDLILATIKLALDANTSLSTNKKFLVDELLSHHLPFFKETCYNRINDDLAENQCTDSLKRSIQCYLQIYQKFASVNPMSTYRELFQSVELINIKLKDVANAVGQQLISDYGAEVAAAKVRRDNKRMRAGPKQGEREATKERPAGDFRDIAPYPRVEDITSGQKVKLRKNQLANSFEDVDDYLDVLYRLLREDFVATIRDGIKTVRAKTGFVRSGTLRTGGDFRVYTGFTIESMAVNQRGMTYILKVNTSNSSFQSPNWLKSKRLIYGSLICLSLSYFKEDILFATIVKRPRFEQYPTGQGSHEWKTIEISFLEESLDTYIRMNYPSGPFTIVESSAYYEAYIYVLNGMKAFTESSLPFQRHIVYCEKEMEMPEYLRDKQVHYRLPLRYGHTELVPVLEHVRWPTAEELGFNHSQYSAFKAALSQEFSVIQGPPGTGKTYIGLKIVKTLLGNLYNVGPCKDDSFTTLNTSPFGIEAEDTVEKQSPLLPEGMDCPILVVCNTNHALDQFLEGLLKTCSDLHPGDLVRVGSRSKSDALRNYNIRNARQKTSKRLLHGRRDDKNYIIRRCKKIIAVSKTIESGDFDFSLKDLINDYKFLKNFRQKTWQHWLDVHSPSHELEQFQNWRISRMCLKTRQDASESDARTSPKEELVDEDFAGDGREIIGVDSDSSDDDAVLRLGAFQQIEPDIDEELMTNQEVAQLKESDHSLWDLSLKDRWRLYKYWLHQYEANYRKELQRHRLKLETYIKMDTELSAQADLDVMKRAKIVGMTTTAAARLQKILQDVGAKIIIVEEAAEVLEAHIITALSPRCQQLILIGDHKQLRPSTAVYDLAKNYNLNVSLFERMVNNGIPLNSLNVQHRMRPEVSKFIREHIYEDLEDHPSVTARAPVKGVSSSVFFFNHSEPETNNQDMMSKSNEFEAEMIVKFARYLQRQGYEGNELTIITMYKGQEMLLRKKMKGYEEFQGLRVTSVDNFQGEENEIILVSLVRSNDGNKLGFIGEENRVCVTMSRAKRGMYVFGNFDMIANQSEIWSKIVTEAKKNGEYADKLLLSCWQHRISAYVQKPDDFDKLVPLGGCTQVCNIKLPCGHKCEETCHSYDLEHEEFICWKKCEKRCAAGHRCQGICGHPCPPCPEICEVTLELCSHTVTTRCYKQFLSVQPPCTHKCEKELSCGHICKNKCGEPCQLFCTEEVEKACSRCGDLRKVMCSLENFECGKPCGETLPCGHICGGTCSSCWVEGKPAHIPCVRLLPCGHGCAETLLECTADDNYKSVCKKKCLLRCSHQTQCSNRCDQVCEFKETLTKCAWGCKEHGYCSKKCGESCTHSRCSRSCKKMVKCDTCKKDEVCRGLCGQTCPHLCKKCKLPEAKEKALMLPDIGKDLGQKWLVLEDCKHLVPVYHMDKLVDAQKSDLPILCPYKDCKKPVLNTGRYVRVTRAPRLDSQQTCEQKHTPRHQNKERHQTAKDHERNSELSSHARMEQARCRHRRSSERRERRTKPHVRVVNSADQPFEYSGTYETQRKDSRNRAYESGSGRRHEPRSDPYHRDPSPQWSSIHSRLGTRRRRDDISPIRYIDWDAPDDDRF